MPRYMLVSQEDEWGCGAACVASLLGISYAEAKQLVEDIKGESVNAHPYGLELHHIALALKEKGVKVVADWSPDSMPDGSIVCISGPPPYDGEHYMLQTPHGWMDPWHNLEEAKMAAKYRKKYPKETEFLVALVPVNVNSVP